MTSRSASIALLVSRAPASLATDRTGDAELVERARAGDAWAEATIYQRYAPRVANLAARLLGDRSEALDVVQDVFVDALDELSTLRDPGALRSWLMRRTVRRVHRVFRRRKLWRWVGVAHQADPDLALDALASDDASPEARAELSRAALVLATLPDRQHIAWVLHRVEGETLPAVATACAVSLATVKRDIAAAQAALDAHTEEEDV